MSSRLKAPCHELRCWECGVTWASWAQRLAGLKCGYTPKLSKQHRHLVDRARRAEATIERVRSAIESERAGALESEAMDGPRSSHDARLNTCAHIEDALREPPEHGIPDQPEKGP